MHHVLVYVSHKLLPSIALSSTCASLASQNFDLQYSQNIAIVLTEFHSQESSVPKERKSTTTVLDILGAQNQYVAL